VERAGGVDGESGMRGSRSDRWAVQATLIMAPSRLLLSRGSCAESPGAQTFKLIVKYILGLTFHSLLDSATG